MVEKNGKKKENIPEMVIDDMARCLLPKIQEFFNSPEGKKEFEKWLNDNEEEMVI